MASPSFIWSRIYNNLDKKLSSSVASSWFEDVELNDFSNNVLTLYVENSFRRTMVINQYTEYIKEAYREEFGGKEIDVVVLGSDDVLVGHSSKQRQIFEFNPNYTFDTFVVGASNRFAFANAKLVAESPGEKFNPLLIYGNPGLGKTHLLYAIANTIRKNHPDYHICFVNGDSFTNELVASIRDHKQEAFQKKYREADVFLFDDIQFLARTELSAQEFSQTYNILHEMKKQIVMTSDKHPSLIQQIPERVSSRLVSGLIADIQSPDYETKMAIIQTKAEYEGIKLEPEMVEYIAEIEHFSNVRILEGVVQQIYAYHDLYGNPITMDLVKSIVANYPNTEASAVPSSKKILKEVATFYSINEKYLLSKAQNREALIPRRAAAYLLRELTGMSTNDIGKLLNRDHTTIMNALKQAKTSIESNDIAFITAIGEIKSCIERNR